MEARIPIFPTACSRVCRIFLCSIIRQAMMNIMLAPVSPNQSGSTIPSWKDQRAGGTLAPPVGGGVSPEEDTTSSANRFRHAVAQKIAMNASKCMFWCAVALGGLAQGRPIALVSSALLFVCISASLVLLHTVGQVNTCKDVSPRCSPLASLNSCTSVCVTLKCARVGLPYC